ncbi:MAG: fibronectin type III domain-containing protein [Desulfovibrionales bacterium]
MSDCNRNFLPKIAKMQLMFLTIFCLSTVFFLSVAHASGVTLEWDHHSDSSIQGYNLHYRTDNKEYKKLVDAGYDTQISVSGLSDTTYHFAVTAYDAEGNESGYSSEVSFDAGSSAVIVDNGQKGTTSTGNWNDSSGKNPYGSTSLDSMDSDARYTFEAAISGTSEVALWWTDTSNRCSSVPVEIYDGTTLLDTVYVNQQLNGGKWNALGTYSFTEIPRVQILSQDSCSTCADAVSFSFASTSTGSTPTGGGETIDIEGVNESPGKSNSDDLSSSAGSSGGGGGCSVNPHATFGLEWVLLLALFIGVIHRKRLNS